MLDELRRSLRSLYHNNDSHQPSPESPRGPPGGGWLREWERERDRQSRHARDNYLRQREMETAKYASYQPPFQPLRLPPALPGGNWLREWEQKRDRQSRRARENYLRQQVMEIVDGIAPSAGLSGLEERGRAGSLHFPLTQLSEIQAQKRILDEYTARREPRPWPTTTRASLAAMGFANDDLSDQWSHDDNVMDLWGSLPRRRPGVLPPSNEADAPAQYSEPNSGRISDLPVTESPPSLLQEFINRSRNEHYHDSFSTVPWERWDVQLARPQSELDRLRQLLHSRSGEPGEREPPRRLLTDLRRPTTTQTLRSAYSLENEPVFPTSLEPITTQWPREYQRQSYQQDDRASWSSSDSPTSRSNFHDIIRAVRRRRALLPESSATPRRWPSSTFLNSMDRLQRNVDWPASRQKSRQHELDTSLTSYFKQRQAQWDALPKAVRSI
ncbi:hypothetical protein FRC12_010458 [Ceratobasidium sp. 428]|nr:hypothetical protein FRC12_010458 [Ceratobasidium sp. 428]